MALCPLYLLLLMSLGQGGSNIGSSWLQAMLLFVSYDLLADGTVQVSSINEHGM